MPQADQLRVLQIDGVKHLIEDLSPEIQQLVAVYNEWNQDAVVARKRSAQATAAVEQVLLQINEQLRREAAEAEQAENIEQLNETTTAIKEQPLIDPADGEPLIDTN